MPPCAKCAAMISVMRAWEAASRAVEGSSRSHTGRFTTRSSGERGAPFLSGREIGYRKICGMQKANLGECGFDRHAAMSGIEHRGKERQILGDGEKAFESVDVADIMGLFGECPAG